MIDWDRVNELRDEVGDEDFLEVVEMFLEEVEEVMDRLNASAQGAEESDMHFLKGSALNLGFSGFADLCRDGEMRAKDGAGAETDLDEIMQAYMDAKADFMKKIA